MPPVVIDFRSAEDWRDVVHQAVQALAEGKLVAFPTETVYGIAASALDERGVRRLVGTQGPPPRPSADPGHQERRRGAGLRPRHERPGPAAGAAVLAGTDHLGGRRPASGEPASGGFPPAVQSAVSPEQTIGLRVPGHEVILDVLRMLAGPLALTSANLGRPARAPSPPSEVLDALGDRHRSGAGRRAVPLRPAFLGGPRRRAIATRSSARASCPKKPCNGWPA